MKKKSKYIYKIENVVNGKVYIGQSVNPKGRFKAHTSLKDMNGSKEIKEDLKKYGAENFTLEILEECEDYNEKEKHYIKLYNSLITQQGYNIQEGGDLPPISFGEQNNLSQHSDYEIDEIIELLIKTDLSNKEIAERYNYKDTGTINRINNGEIRRKEGIKYPIRDLKGVNEASKIKDLLENSNLTQKEISKLLGCARSKITMINIGANHYDEQREYPIRKGRIK